MMKNHKFFGAIACSVIALTISSCGKEDKIERLPELPYALLHSDRLRRKATPAFSSVIIEKYSR